MLETVSGVERRRDTRYRYRLEITVKMGGKVQRLFTEDVSYRGLFARTDTLPVMRQLITWHAIEEVEHKTVAYDVLQATYPNYFLRVFGFMLATVTIMGFGVAGMRMLIRQDGLTRKQLRAYRRELRTAKEVEMGKRMTSTLLQYLRPSFHPNDVDDQHLIAKHLPDIPMMPPKATPALA